MKRIIITLTAMALIAGALTGWQISSSSKQNEMGEIRSNNESIVSNFGLSKEKAQEQQERFDQTPKQGKEKELRKAFLQISLTRPDENTNQNLVKLALGLNSAEETVRGSAILMVQSLLIEVAHGTVKPDPSIEPTLKALFSLYKNRAQSQIAKLQRAFPKSPTLNYLQQI